MLTRLAFLLCALATSLAAQPAPATSEPAASSPETAIQLHVARSGGEVIVTWDLPSLTVKGVDIYRNTRANPQGRTRLDFVRAEPALFYDKVPEPETIYWYWIKVVLPSGQSINIGPVQTPDSKIWAP